MKTFETFRETINYIPNCVMCGKDMQITIRGIKRAGDKPWRSQNLSLLMEIKNNLLAIKVHGRAPAHTHVISALAIDIDSNKILEGEEMINDMTGWIHVNKTCRTCHFKISFMFNSVETRVKGYFPPVFLHNEIIQYTMSAKRDVKIHKTYGSDMTLSGEKTFISVNGKLIKEVPFDFSKFQNLKQITRRIETIATFQ